MPSLDIVISFEVNCVGIAVVGVPKAARSPVQLLKIPVSTSLVLSIE